MLQQTQVARVIERWHRFLDRFPTAQACAAAPVGDTIDEWSGLGYNRRAVFLHRLATEVTEDHHGAFPRTLKELLALPGIGAYTARAIMAFAFEQPAAVLDTNVARILARTVGRPLGRSEAQAMADRNIIGNPAADSWTWNQAMLDIGARHCSAKGPNCEPCPLLGICSWADQGFPEPDPAIGSAAVSGKQSKFGGSDRQGRGKLVKALRQGPVSRERLAEVMGWPDDPERAARVAATLVTDGLATADAAEFALP